MITKNATIVIKDDKASLNNKLVLYRRDGEIIIYFALSGFNYRFSSDGLTGVVADGVLLKPNGTLMSLNNLSIYGSNRIKFTIDKSMLDELEEVGIHTLQISLYDDSTKRNRITIPPITFEVKEGYN